MCDGLRSRIFVTSAQIPGRETRNSQKVGNNLLHTEDYRIVSIWNGIDKDSVKLYKDFRIF